MPISGSNYTLPTNSFAQPVNGQRFDATAGAATLNDIATALDALVDGSGQAAGSIANAKLANMAEATIKGRASGAGTGVPTDLTASQARAIIDPQLGDFAPASADAVTRTLRAKVRELGVSVTDFGAVGDNVADDWPAFQKAINAVASAGGGRVDVPSPPARYRIKQALRLYSNVTINVLSPSTIIECVGGADYSDESVGLPPGGLAGRTSQYPFSTGCIMFGSSDQTYNNFNLPVKALNAVSLGAATVTLTTLSDNSFFNVGDNVWVEDTTTWVPFGPVTGFPAVSFANEYPVSAQFNRITAINRATGVITLLNPMSQAISSARLRNFTTTGGVNVKSFDFGTSPITVHDSGVPYWTSYNAAVIGGTWIHNTGSFTISGGGIGCTFRPDAVYAYYDAYAVNTLVNCDTFTPYAKVGRHAAEMALFSSGTRHTFGTVIVTGVSEGANAVIRCGEGSNNNTISVGFIHNATPYTNTSADLENIIHVHNASDNSVTVNSIVGNRIKFRVANISNYDSYSGATSPLTLRNSISVKSSNLEQQESYALIEDASSQYNTISGNFSGLISNGSSYSVQVVSSAGAGNAMRDIVGRVGTAFYQSGVDSTNRLENVVLNDVNQANLAAVRNYATRLSQPIYDSSGNKQYDVKQIFGFSGVMPGSGTLLVTFGGGFSFTGPYTYVATGTDATGLSPGVGVANQTANSILITAPAGSNIAWMCTGY